MTNPGKCRSCNADILWLRSAGTDKPAPIDAAPCDEGNILIDEKRGTYLVLAVPHPQFTGRLHRSHFATCVNAADWRAIRPGATKKGGK